MSDVQSVGATVYTLIEDCGNYFSAVMTDTPVAYYKHSAGDGADSSGNNNNATTTTDVSLVPGWNSCVGSAGSYNGTTSKQLIPNASSIQDLGYINGTTARNFGVEFLIYLMEYPASGWNKVISKDTYTGAGAPGAANGGWDIGINASGEAAVGTIVMIAPTTGGTTLRVYSNSVLALNQWNYVYITMNGGTTGSSCRVFINGVPSDLTLVGIGSTGLASDSGKNLRLGCGADGSGVLNYFLKAFLDEVALYATPGLVRSRIVNHADTLLLNNYTNHAFGTAVIADSPIAYYRAYNLISAGYDDSTNFRDLITETAITTSTGKIDTTASSFNGTTSFIQDDTPHAAFDNLINGGAKMTVETVVKFSSLSTTRTICSKGKDLNYGWQFDVTTAGAVRIVFLKPTTDYILVTANGLITTGNWYHIVGVFDPTGNNTVNKVYINGVSEALTVSSGSTYTPSSDAAAKFNLGRTFNSGGAAGSFMSGLLDEVAIYGTELSSSRVAVHFALTGI